MIRPATMHDAIAMRGKLRERDYAEVWAAHGENPDDVLCACVEHSVRLWCVEDETILAIFGVAPSIREGIGHPWLLGTDGLARCRHVLLRQPQQYLEKMHALFPVLQNFVDVRNTQSVRWLAWLGFSVDPTPVRLGPFSMPFYSFHKEESVCVL